MKAKLPSLQGKYYNTKIRVLDYIDGEHVEVTLEINVGDYGKPSDREFGHPADEQLIEDYLNGYWPCDGHYETLKTYKLASRIVAAINAWDEDE